MSNEEPIRLTLVFNNTVYQEVTINNTFLEVNNLNYGALKDVKISDIIGFLITNWQPSWGSKPINVSQVRFIQQGRSLRTGLALKDLNIGKNSTFNVNMRPVSFARDNNNRRASLLVPNHRRASNVPNSYDDNNNNNLNTNEMNENYTGNSSTYYDRYGLNANSNRKSFANSLYNSPGTRQSYYSGNRQRFSLLEQHNNRSDVTSELTSEDEDFEMIEDENLMSSDVDDVLQNPMHFHHIITTEKGRKEQELKKRIAEQEVAERETAHLKKSQPSKQQNSKRTSSGQSMDHSSNKEDPTQTRRNLESDGGCCVIV